jgi:hypothetical protein
MHKRAPLPKKGRDAFLLQKMCSVYIEIRNYSQSISFSALAVPYIILPAILSEALCYLLFPFCLLLSNTIFRSASIFYSKGFRGISNTMFSKPRFYKDYLCTQNAAWFIV